MARSRAHALESLADTAELVVKRTFIEFVNESHEASAAKGLGRRVCSDPALCAIPEWDREEPCLDGSGQVGQIGFDLAGLSDGETESERAGDRALPCYRHIRELTASSTSATLSEDDVGEATGAEEEVVSTAAAEAQRVLDHLASENQRLALQNRLLRENARLQLENQLLAQGAGLDTASCWAWAEVGQQEEPWLPAAWPAGAHSELAGGALEHDRCLGWDRDRGQAQAKPQRAPGWQPAEPAWVAAGTSAPEGPLTTIMLRNLPNNYSRAMVLAMLDDEGFAGKYDFAYLPIDFKSHACLGYAFINMVDEEAATALWSKFDGFSKWVLPSKKVCCVSWSGPHQGLWAHIERYRNSPVMHASVPDEYKPVVFEDGVRLVFPAPTKNPRAPRIRHDKRAARAC